MSDMGCVKRILQGDKAAGERLVRENYRRVFGVLRSLADSREAAEDLTQQTFVQAWQALPGFRGEARLSTWLCRIAYHEYTRWRRTRRECQALDSASEIQDPKAVIGLRTVLFARAIDQLSDELRETFLLHYEREFAVKEIAVMLDVPEGTVKSRLFAGRARMRTLLSEDEVETESSRLAALPAVASSLPLTIEEKAL